MTAPAGPEEPREGKCLTCGAAIVDALAGCCHACGAEDSFIGSQWLSMPADQHPLATTPAPDTGAEERLRAALELLPTFEVGQVVGDLQPGRHRHDRCSVHGDIGPMESIDAHARRVHGATSAAIREARDTLLALSGGSVDEERDTDES